jgi:protein TonB
MFDTSQVRTRSRGLRLLPISVALHSAAVVLAISASIASVEFPETAPKQTEIYTPVVAPAVPPLPLGRPAPAPKPAPRQVDNVPAPAPVHAPETAPTDIAPIEATTSSGAGTGTDVTGPIGHPDGKPWGIDVGQQPGGTGTAPVADGPLHPGGDVLPARVLRRVEPRYPAIMVQAKKSAVVTVRCVIGRDGKARNPEIILSSFPPFNEAVLDAVQKWTFAPGTMNGDPVDTWFELTVSFQVR